MSNSDANAKEMCKEYLMSKGYTVLEGKTKACDIECEKDGVRYYFEVKSSTKDKTEPYRGTVMLSEMRAAINNKATYRFLVCKGNDKNHSNWEFKIFEVDEFMKYCALTTPILRYAYHEKWQPQFKGTTTKASDELIKLMAENYDQWQNLSQTTDDEDLKKTISEMNEEDAQILMNWSGVGIFFQKGKLKFWEKDNDKFWCGFSSKHKGRIAYWYGISKNVIQLADEQRLTHILLKTDLDGDYKIPFDIIKNIIKEWNLEPNKKGYYHIQLKENDNGDLVIYKSQKPEFSIKEYAV